MPFLGRLFSRRPSRALTRLHVEGLEDRSLPSAIVWTNRGSAGNDSDSFNAVFGARADTARAVVDAALQTWQNVIQDFHYADGGNTFSLNISVNPASLGTGALTWVGVQTDGQGRPKAGRIQLDSGNDRHGSGYFLDPNAYNSPAFQGNLVNASAREATPGGPAAYLGDLFTIVLHETTHALGINSDPGELLTRNAGGYLHNTGVPDAVDRPGTLFTFTGPDVNFLFTSDDGDAEDTGTATHAARAGNVYTDPVTHQTFTGAVDSMNPVYLYGRRVLQSPQIALVLHDVYGYTITTPQGFTPSNPPPPPPVQTTPPSGPVNIVVTGSDGGTSPLVQVYDAAGGAFRFSFYAYDAGFTGGVRVAVAKVNGTPTIITAPGPGTAPLVRFFDGTTGSLLREFLAYAPGFTGGVNVAVGDVNGDGFPDLVTGAAAGNPHVKVYNGKAFADGSFNSANPDASLLVQFFPYALQYNVGASVAVGDVNGDGFADVVTGATAGNPDVRVYNGKDIATGAFNLGNPDASLLTQFFAYGLNFNVGVNVAVGDVNGDGFADVVTGATAGNPHVKVFDGKAVANGSFNRGNPDASLLAQFFAYGAQFNLGASVAVADANGDGYADVITGATAGNPHVKVYSGKATADGSWDSANPDASLVEQFFATNSQTQGGVMVGAANLKGTGS